jgi:hypothetical protein
MPDTRIVYSVSGTWWDSIDKIATRDGLPCCPQCGSLLFETGNMEDWQRGVDRFDITHPGYAAMVKWGRGKCFPDMAALATAYAKETGQPIPYPKEG